MLCCSERCEKKNQCGLYYRNPQPEYRKYDNLEPLDSHGWGSIGYDGHEVYCESHYDCGPLGDYAMFTPIPEQVLFEKIAAEINSCGFGVNVAPENIRALVKQFKNKEETKTAHWIYWDGWIGNSDQRIDDATCSECGYKHPTVWWTKGDEPDSTPDKLEDYCPCCKAAMRKR